jgi:inosine-uridine nucleoside N-ribohydrolase
MTIFQNQPIPVLVDPDAAQIVMESGITLTLVGLDVAMKAPLPRQVVEDNLQRRPSKVTQFIADCTGIYMAFYRDNEGFYGCYLHDPLAMAVAIDPSLSTLMLFATAFSGFKELSLV